MNPKYIKWPLKYNIQSNCSNVYVALGPFSSPSYTTMLDNRMDSLQILYIYVHTCLSVLHLGKHLFIQTVQQFLLLKVTPATLSYTKLQVSLKLKVRHQSSRCLCIIYVNFSLELFGAFISMLSYNLSSIQIDFPLQFYNHGKLELFFLGINYTYCSNLYFAQQGQKFAFISFYCIS